MSPDPRLQAVAIDVDPPPEAPPEPPPAAPRAERDVVPGLGRIAAGLVIGGIGLAGASALRLSDDWEAGRWWMLDIALLAVGLLVAVRAAWTAVGATIEALQRRHTTQGGVRAAIGLVALLALVGGLGVRLAEDWDVLDVPAAWDRVDLPFAERDDLPAIPSAAAVDEAVEAGGLCYSGTEILDSAEVGCEEPHRLEVLDTVTLAGADGFPDRDDLSAQARELCADVAHGELSEGMAVGTDVPDRDAWTNGSRTAACVVRVAGAPVTGSVAKP